MRVALGATARDIYMVVARSYGRPIVVGPVSGLLIAVSAAAFVQRGLVSACENISWSIGCLVVDFTRT